MRFALRILIAFFAAVGASLIFGAASARADAPISYTTTIECSAPDTCVGVVNAPAGEIVLWAFQITGEIGWNGWKGYGNTYCLGSDWGVHGTCTTTAPYYPDYWSADTTLVSGFPFWVFQFDTSGNHTVTIPTYWDASPRVNSTINVIVYVIPSATPTPQIATPMPLSTLTCITATTSVNTPTRTPFAMTPTPGGPTATRTPTPVGTLTPTPGPKYDSGTVRFDTSLAPYSASPYTNTAKITQWENTTGIDNMPGVAYVKDNMGLFPAEVGQTTTAAFKGQIVLGVSQLTFPFSVSGYAKQEIRASEVGYVNIWYFDPDYSGVGQGAWVAAAAIRSNSTWDMFSVVVQRQGGSGKVSAVAFGEVLDPSDLDRGIYFDNLRVSSGRDGSHLPTCGTQGGAGGSGIGGVKQCVIKITYVDASTCTQPTGIDVSGWLSFWFCRLWYYFNFGPANRAQVSDIVARQNANEPIGTLNELDDSFSIVSGMLSDIFAINAANTVEYRTFDASLLLDWSAIDSPPDIAAAAQADVGDFMSGCSDAIRNVSQTVQQSACWTVSAIRNSRYPFLSIVQWGWDITWLIVFAAYFNAQWTWRLSGG